MKGKPRINQTDVDRLRLALSSGRWIKGRELVDRYRFKHRMIRAIAEETGEIISGQQGYKLASMASKEELRIAHADLTSRARHILARADRVERLINKPPAPQDLFL